MNLNKLERYLQVNLLGTDNRLMLKNLPGRGLTKVEKPCCILRSCTWNDRLVHLLAKLLRIESFYIFSELQMNYKYAQDST